MKEDFVEYSDVLVIGSGIAGASAALHASDFGLDVALLNKESDPEESNSKYAQGGIAGLGENDSPALLAEDILNAGDELCNPAAVEIIAREGPVLIRKVLMERLGVEFDKASNGEIDLTREGAHSCRRILHYRDATGQEVERKFIQALKGQPRITIFPEHLAIDLVTFPHHSRSRLRVYEDDICCGAYVLDLATGKVKRFFAPVVILATGGIGQVYLHTTNPRCATGDGIAMAYRAGAKVINAEFIQFHPTALFIRDEERFLISEALRGEGARLRNRRGELFMSRYSQEYEDLAPRDVVTRAIWEEMARCGDNYVLLDIASFAPKDMDIKERFPTIYQKCRSYGIDITREPIPVVPAAHYFCGGIKVDAYGRTGIRNLYAVGEVSCTGVHGANRLASISLLEGLVWGERTAKNIASTFKDIPKADYREVPPWEPAGVGEEVDPVLISQDWLTIKTTMWNYAGIVRTRKRLERAQADMSYLHRRIMQFYKESTLTRGLIEIRNAIIVARLLIDGALINTTSSGCHFRRD